MKTEPNDLITPVQCTDHAPGFFNALTKREYFAALAMQGILMDRNLAQDILTTNGYKNDGMNGFQCAAFCAVIQADKLIEALNGK